MAVYRMAPTSLPSSQSRCQHLTCPAGAEQPRRSHRVAIRRCPRAYRLGMHSEPGARESLLRRGCRDSCSARRAKIGRRSQARMVDAEPIPAMRLTSADGGSIGRILSGATQGAAVNRSAQVVGCVKEVLLRRREDLRSSLIIPLGIREGSTSASHATDGRQDHPDADGDLPRGSRGLPSTRHRPPSPSQRAVRASPHETLLGEIEAASFSSPR